MLKYLMRLLFTFLFAASISAQPATLHPRVVIVVYFEVGADTGDRPGELQTWVERDHLIRTIDVPGMSRTVRSNADGSELAITIGPGNIKPGVNLMAFAADPRFDLRQTYWLINGIAGISPADGTIGSAVWTDFVINGDLTKEIDPREAPPTWPDGFLSLDGVTPTDRPNPGWEDDVRHWTGDDAHANRRGNVIRLNLALMRWAYNLTKDAPLPEDAAMKSLRQRFPNQPGTAAGPRVQTGANLATEIFWTGAKMDAWAHRWVAFETAGVTHPRHHRHERHGHAPRPPRPHRAGQGRLEPGAPSSHHQQLRHATPGHHPRRQPRQRATRRLHRLPPRPQRRVRGRPPHRGPMDEMSEPFRRAAHRNRG
jgi:purine nucleoside permease